MINPRVDIAFKKIFGVEENKDILISLLNSIVSEHDQIDQIELLNPYNERNYPLDKLSILDIKARNKNTGTYYLIEMQIADETDYHQRSLYCWARVYSNQLASGTQYKNLKKTIAIHILNFTLIDYQSYEGWKEEYINKYHHCFTLQDKVTKVEIFDDLEIHTIELSKFEGLKSEDLNLVLSKVKGMLDAWVAILTRYALLDVNNLPTQINTPEIKKALQIMQEMEFTAYERDLYNTHLDFLRMEYSAFEKKFNDGMKKGREEGLEKGLEKGREEEKINIAKAMLRQGIEIKLIALFTGLSEESVTKLIISDNTDT